MGLGKVNGAEDSLLVITYFTGGVLIRGWLRSPRARFAGHVYGWIWEIRPRLRPPRSILEKKQRSGGVSMWDRGFEGLVVGMYCKFLQKALMRIFV